MNRSFRPAALAAALCITFAATNAHADRRYFVQSYTPYLAPAGNLELEVQSNAFSGQGDSLSTAWQNRIEFEYGVTDRFTAAAYLNFIQSSDGEAASRFDGPSLEFIYRLADPGRLPIDPGAYFEVRANGSELELEPKLLLARRIYRLVTVANVIGEWERIEEPGGTSTTEKLMTVTLGASREVGKVFAFGFEAVYTREFADQGEDPSRVLLGPSINFQTPKVQFALGWHPQISGSPSSVNSLNLADFPRSEVRLLIGVNL